MYIASVSWSFFVLCRSITTWVLCSFMLTKAFQTKRWIHRLFPKALTEMKFYRNFSLSFCSFRGFSNHFPKSKSFGITLRRDLIHQLTVLFTYLVHATDVE